MGSSKRITSERLQEMTAALSDRDLATLDAIGRYRLMTVKHATKLVFSEHSSEATGARVCRRVLGRLHKQRLIHRLERRVGGVRAGSAGYIYALSPVGHRLLGHPRRKRNNEPGWQFINHTLAVTDLGTAVTSAAHDRGLDVLGVLPEPMAWRTYEGHLGHVTVKPDLTVAVADAIHELSWFVEVDLATESGPTIQRKCQVYVDYWQSGVEQLKRGVFPKILWVVPDEHRASAVTRAINATIDAVQLFNVTTNEQAIDHLLDFNDDS